LQWLGKHCLLAAKLRCPPPCSSSMRASLCYEKARSLSTPFFFFFFRITGCRRVTPQVSRVEVGGTPVFPLEVGVEFFFLVPKPEESLPGGDSVPLLRSQMRSSPLADAMDPPSHDDLFSEWASSCPRRCSSRPPFSMRKWLSPS